MSMEVDRQLACPRSLGSLKRKRRELESAPAQLALAPRGSVRIHAKPPSRFSGSDHSLFFLPPSSRTHLRTSCRRSTFQRDCEHSPSVLLATGWPHGRWCWARCRCGQLARLNRNSHHLTTALLSGAGNLGLRDPRRPEDDFAHGTHEINR